MRVKVQSGTPPTPEETATRVPAPASRYLAVTPPTAGRPAAADDPDVGTGEEIVVSWPEEKISPRVNSFSTCTVGGLSYKTTVRPRESVAQAFDRAYSVLRMLAEQHRDEKLRSFLKTLDDVLNGRLG